MARSKRKNDQRPPSDKATATPSEVVIRLLRTYQEYQACVALQKETWGAHFTECVPPSLLMVGQKLGGISAGAFDQDGRLVGFVFGLTGVQQGRPVHWSDMLAVRPGMRGLGLGRRLKLYQRERLLERGVEMVYWTYDPLEAANAHLNLNRLGAEITEYVPDMYGEDSGSPLHRGLGMDRFVVAWPIASEQVARQIAGQVENQAHRFDEAPLVNPRCGTEGTSLPVADERPLTPLVRIEIPADIQALKARSLELAGCWRSNTRRAFLWYLEQAYQVTAFYRDRTTGRCFYGLVRKATS